MMPTGHRTVLPRGVNSILVSDLQLARNRSRLGLGEADKRSVHPVCTCSP